MEQCPGTFEKTLSQYFSKKVQGGVLELVEPHKHHFNNLAHLHGKLCLDDQDMQQRVYKWNQV